MSAAAAQYPFVDLHAENGPLMDQAMAAIRRVVESGQLILGPEVDAFEKEIADALGVRNAIGVSSGTDALLVALMALGVGPGDDVLTTPFSFFATAGVVARLGARPVFADIDPTTFNLDPAQVARHLTPRTKCVMPVHLFGQPAAVGAIAEAAASGGTKIPIIEDAAQAIGARTAAGPVGTLGLAACFSFFPTKNLGCFGDGGLVTTEDSALATRIRALRVHGAPRQYEHLEVGGNFRIDAVQAAVLRTKLPHLHTWTDARRRNAARYDELFAAAKIPADLLTPPRRAEAGHIYNQYVIRTPRRDALKAHLAERGIPTMVYYPTPLHLQRCFANLGHREGAFPEAERAAREVLALPIFPTLGEARLTAVVDAIRAFF